MKNSATIAPSLLFPTDRVRAVLASRVVTACSIASLIRAPSSQVKVARLVAFLKYSDSTLTTSIETEGVRLYKCARHKAPVLISAAMLRHAKYVERNGFFVNHLYGTVVTQVLTSMCRMRTPEKNALGKRESKNILDLKGCFSSVMNDDGDSLIIALYIA